MPRQTSHDLRNENRFEVLHALFTLGPSTRQELTRHTGLSTATVATLVNEFLAAGVLRIATVERRTVGRPYERLSIDPDRGRIVGVDVAETYVDATVFDLGLGPLGHSAIALDEHKNDPAYVVDGIVTATENALATVDSGRTELIGVGVSMPGQVQPDAGVSVFAPNWQWHDVRIEELLENRLGISVYVDNPLKAITLAEMWFGVGRVTDTMAVVNLGTGVGAGLAIEGTLIRGATNNAGEWGHTLLQLDGRPCRCGRRGCVEAYLGVHGLEMTLAEIAPNHSALKQPLQRGFVDAVAQGLAADDPELTELARRTAHYLAAALADLVNLLNIPHLTLTGWTSSAIGQWLIPAVRDELPTHVLPGSMAGLVVEASAVPGNPVALGMAAFTLEQYLGRLGVPSPASAPTPRRRLR
ncbi:ROK family transcriptional regulator [Kribbella yunnanensis]|uniref:ROK family transcriptional regulator n=1 Tax=Kribbella yunnanensis TaxID=190194 RepID=A0ABN2J080_9ACTN